MLRVAFDLDGTLADMDQVLRRKAADLFPAPRSTGPGSTVSKAESSTRAPTQDTRSGGQRTDVEATTESGESRDAREAAGDPPADPTHLDLTPSEWRRLWAHVRRTDDFWLSLPEIDDGIVADIAALALERRWEVVFLTTRPPVRGQTTQAQSQKWLHERGFAMPSVFVVQRSRGLIASALELDAVVDDRLENCVDVALESKAVPILIRPSPFDSPQGSPEHRRGASASTAQNQSRPSGVRVVASIREAVALLQQIDDERRPGMVRSIKRWLGR